MIRLSFALLVLSLFPQAILAQSTTVSGTITDSGGQVWFEGTYRIDFNTNGTVGPYVWNGSPFSPVTTFSGNLDASGHFSGVSVPSNNVIFPAGTVWKFTICSAAIPSPCYSVNLPVTGATLDVSTLIVPPAVTIDASRATHYTAYNDNEIQGPAVGTSYENLVDGHLHLCTVSLPCTWVVVCDNGAIAVGGCNGGGGGGVGPGIVNNVAKFTTTTNVGNSSVTDDGVNPTRAPDGLDSAGQGMFSEWTVDTGGVTANYLACRSNVNKVQTCAAAATTGVIGVAQSTVSSGGTVEVCWAAHCFPTAATNVTAGDWLIPSLSQAGKVDDAGATEPSATQTFQAEATVSSGSLVQTTILSLDTIGASSIGPHTFAQTPRTVISSYDSTTGLFGGSLQSQCVDQQSGTTYTIPNSDFGCIVEGSNVSAQTYTIPDAGSSGFGTGFYIIIYNCGGAGTPCAASSANITVQRQTASVFLNKASATSISLAPGQYVTIWSPDNVNWNAFIGTDSPSSGAGAATFITADGTGSPPPNYQVLTAGSGITLTPNAGSHTMTVATSGGSTAFSAVTSGTNTAASMVVGTGANLDVSGTGTVNATSVNPIGGATQNDCAGFSATGAANISLTDIGACLNVVNTFGVTAITSTYTVAATDDKHFIYAVPTSNTTVTLPQPSSGITNFVNGYTALCTSFPSTLGSCSVTMVSVTPGNAIRLQVGAQVQTAGSLPTWSVSDGVNTYSQLYASPFWVSAQTGLWAWASFNVTGGSTTLTVTCLTNCSTGGSGSIGLVATQYTGVTGPGDGTISYITNSGLNKSISITTSRPPDVVFIDQNGSAGPGVPFIFREGGGIGGNQKVNDTYAFSGGTQAYSIFGQNGSEMVISALHSTLNTIQFTNGFWFLIQNNSTNGSDIILTPTSSTLTTQNYAGLTSAATNTVYPHESALCMTDGINWYCYILGPQVYSNSSPVTVSGNVNTAQNLMSTVVKANTLNQTNDAIHVWAGGYYSTEAVNTSTITVTASLGGTTMCSWVSGANLGGQSNDTWNVDMTLISTGTGTIGLKCHGKLALDGISSAASDSLYNDTNHATTGTVNLAVDETLQFTITFSVAGSANGNIGVQDQMTADKVF